MISDNMLEFIIDLAELAFDALREVRKRTKKSAEVQRSSRKKPAEDREEENKHDE